MNTRLDRACAYLIYMYTSLYGGSPPPHGRGEEGYLGTDSPGGEAGLWMEDRSLLLADQLIVGGFVLGDLIDETWVIPLDRRPREETIAYRALDIVLEASHHSQ